MFDTVGNYMGRFSNNKMETIITFLYLRMLSENEVDTFYEPDCDILC